MWDAFKLCPLFCGVYLALQVASANGEDLKVQLELLRHADIRTTMNIYTQAMTDQKRQAHSRIVHSVLAKPTELGAPVGLIAP